MAGWNGSGTFTRTHNWQQDQANGIKIRADRHDANDTDFVNGINNCLTLDGQNTPSADLPMGGNKHTAVGKATSLDEYVTAEQIVDSELVYYTASGTDTYTLTPSPGITAYAAGQSFLVLFTNGNTGAATINVNALGAESLVNSDGDALASGDIAAGGVYKITYDGSNFQVSGLYIVKDDSVTTVKILDDNVTTAKIADSNVTTAKIADDAVTAAKIDINGAGSGTIVASDEILFSDANDSDNVKKDTVQGIVDLLPLTVTAQSSEQTLTLGGLITYNHGLSAVPKAVTLELVCKSAELGFSINDRLLYNPNGLGSSGSSGIATVVNSTSVRVRLNGTGLNVNRFDNGGVAGITEANWRLVITVFA